jgi:hypothetical protein
MRVQAACCQTVKIPKLISNSKTPTSPKKSSRKERRDKRVKDGARTSLSSILTQAFVFQYTQTHT